MFKKKDKPSQAILRAALAQGLHLYYVKYLGKEEVPEAKGDKVVDYALHQILQTRQDRKREGLRSTKVELSVSITGIKVTDRRNGHVYIDIPLGSVSYCQDDRRGNNIFCFIAKEKSNMPKSCYAFKSDNQAGEIMNDIGTMFKQAREKNLLHDKSEEIGNATVGERVSHPPPEISRSSLQSPRPGATHPPTANAGARPAYRAQSQPKQSQPDPFEDVVKDTAATFEDDFKFAMARVASTQPKEADNAFAPASTAAPSSLAKIHAAGFESTTVTAASSSGFDDSLVAAAPATPVSAAKTTTKQHNPYARKRGAPPPQNVHLTSRIHVPEDVKAMAKKPQKPKPKEDFDDDDFFAQIATTRTAKQEPVAGVAAEGGVQIDAAAFDFAPRGEEPTTVPPPLSDDEDTDAEGEEELMHQLSQSLRVDDPEEQAAMEPEAEVEKEEAQVAPAPEQEAAPVAAESDTEVAAEVSDEPVDPAASPLILMCQDLWNKAEPEDELLSGAKMRPVMVKTGLANGVLGEIWSMVDVEQTGVINYSQFGYILGLLSQAQRGEPLDTSTIGPSTPVPTIAGYN
eukprot:m.25586 g.25586  ORF g.25586 m.25586 type:complete len:571 (-) comp8736_c0_seq1:200-1912(-)